MLASLLTGITLGFSAGMNPGPLTSLVITSTLEGGFKSGLRVAAAPLMTDLPIILIATLLVRALPLWAEVTLSVAGALYLGWLGYKTIVKARTAYPPAAGAVANRTAVDLRRGVVVNLLSPSPWIFWMTVGAPILLGALQQGWDVALAFIVGFYLLLVGGKVVLAAVLAGSRTHLNVHWYRGIFFVSGALLLVLAIFLLRDAWFVVSGA